MFFPDYKSVEDAQTRAACRTRGAQARSEEGELTVVDNEHGASRNLVIKGMYIMGSIPGDVRPGASMHRQTRPTSSILSCRTCSHRNRRFTRRRLPASTWPGRQRIDDTNRQVQMGRQALPLPGDARKLTDIRIIEEIADRMGCNWNYAMSARSIPRWRR